MITRRRRKREVAELSQPKKGVDPGYKPVRLQPRTKNQRDYIRCIHENDVTLCTGPAGTGKTHVAVGMAVQMVRHEFLDRIVFTRPLVSVGKDMGYLPGDIMDKVGPYITPCFDELNYYLSLSMIKQWENQKIIEVVPLSMMRGRTFSNAFVILDEAQNATMTELRMLLTRLGDNSRFVLAGDTDQSDLYLDEQGAFEEICRRLEDIDGIGYMELTSQDIVRHPLIQKIIKRI